MKITIETIPNYNQRYLTSGDWWFTPFNGDLEIRVSDMGNWKYEALIAIHEALEALICKMDNIPEEAITAYDKEFEKLRENHPELIGDMEPGDMTSAIYHEPHKFATEVEKLFAIKLGVDWDSYNSTVNAL